ncbi:MAG: flagellar export chaperone FliS, partial [Steroidobacteraceae bacterium]
MSSPHAAKLAAYSSTSAHGGVAAADPHRLIIMLMDGALERIATARGCIARGETVEKARLLNRAV